MIQNTRDFIFEHCYNIKSPRRTKDIDIGVKVANWVQFNKLSEALLSSRKFSKVRDKQRYLFNYICIDIIPFGRITNKNKRISWPPEHEISITLLGFEEAYNCSITIKLSSKPKLDIEIQTIEGHILFKNRDSETKLKQVMSS